MESQDVANILAAIGDLRKVVFDAIDHVCTRVNVLELDRAAREAAEKVRAEARQEAYNLQEKSEKKKVNWSMVMTGTITAASIAVTIAAVKVILTDFSSFAKYIK